MKKRKTWRFSAGGAALFLLLLCAPFFIALSRRWPAADARHGWQWAIFLAVLLLLTALVWFISLRPLIRQELWKIPRTWFEGCFGISVLYAFFALFVFVTGYTPSKYNPHAVPRSSGVVYLYWAVIPFIIGCACYAYDRYRMPRQRR